MKQLAILISFFCATSGWSQEAPPDRVTVPFSDPSRPKSLHASLVNGSITVKGYDGKDVIVDARPDSRHHRERPERADGLHRIEMGATGLTVEESDNVITVGTRMPSENMDLVIQVPTDTSLKLHSVNGGNIVVDHIVGDVEIDNTNGNAAATHISGAAVVHALNGKVMVSLDKVSDKPMSFSSLNGDIDVTLPADIKARLKLKTDNGQIYSDLDISSDPASRKPVMEESNSGKGKYRVKFDRTVYGLLNGGGPEIQLTTFNGNIYIRKSK